MPESASPGTSIPAAAAANSIAARLRSIGELLRKETLRWCISGFSPRTIDCRVHGSFIIIPRALKPTLRAVSPYRSAPRRDRHAQGVEHGHHVDDLLRRRRRPRAAGNRSPRSSIPIRLSGHAADRALQRDRPHPPADVQQFVDLRSELSMMTAPAASAVMSLRLAESDADRRCRQSAGASLMPSPRNSVFARCVSVAHQIQLLLGTLARSGPP